MMHLLTPPTQGGVFDFTARLQAELGADRAKLIPLARENAAQALAAEAVFLQMSGYGYAKRGAPLWLLGELARRRGKIGRLGVYFHELYAFGPPWASSFWLSPAQRHVARRLAETADFWVTNREGSAAWLRRFAGGKPHAVLPVFSNVGEAAAFGSERTAKIVVFGGAGLRLATYQAAGDALFAWARRESLAVHDIGPLIEDAGWSARLRAHQVVQHGRLEAGQVSRLLADARFGVVAYPAEYVAKSSVFGAYCAHGACPVLISKKPVQADGLSPGRHYWPGVPAADVGKAASIGRAAWDWYQPHRLARHAGELRRLLETSGNAGLPPPDNCEP